MSRRRSTISVSADVYIDEILEDVDSDDLIEELKARGKWQEVGRQIHALERDWDLLAELIAEGRSREALDLLASIAPVKFEPSIVTNIVAHRCGRRA